MTDPKIGIAIRFIRSYDMSAELAQQRACQHRHCVTLGPLAICRDCLETFPVSIHPLAGLAALQPPDSTAGTGT